DVERAQGQAAEPRRAEHGLDVDGLRGRSGSRPDVPAPAGGAAGAPRGGGETRRRLGAVARLWIRTASVESLVSTLSGGNQQKVVFARWLVAGARAAEHE